MTIDIVCGAIILMLSFLGWRSGLLQQVIRVGAALCAFFGAGFVAQIVREVWAAEAEVAPPMSEAFSLAVAGALIYITISLAGWLSIKTMRAASETLSDMDRNLGAALGAVKGAIIIYIILSVFIVASVPLEKHDPGDKFHIRDGYLMPLVQRYNIILPWQFPRMKTFHRMLEVAHLVETEKLHDAVRDDTKVSDVLRVELVQKMIKDEGLLTAARDDFYPRTIADPRAREFMNDADNVEALLEVKWDILLGELRGDPAPDAEPEP